MIFHGELQLTQGDGAGRPLSLAPCCWKRRALCASLDALKKELRPWGLRALGQNDILQSSFGQLTSKIHHLGGGRYFKRSLRNLTGRAGGAKMQAAKNRLT